MDTRSINEEYQSIGYELIHTEKCLQYIAESDVSIAFLSSDHEMKKGRKLVGGQCEKVPEKYKWSIPFDFTITIFEPNVERFSDEQIRILLLHELLHIGVEIDGNEESYYIVPHDIEDFKEIIDKYGIDWSDV